RHRLAAALSVAAALVAAGPPARAAPPLAVPRRMTGVGGKAGAPLVRVGLPGLFGGGEGRRPASGGAARGPLRRGARGGACAGSRGRTRGAREEGGPAEPLAIAFQRTEIVYDIWDEKFRLRVTRGKGPEVHVEARTPDEAIARAAALWQFPLIESRRLRAGAS